MPPDDDNYVPWTQEMADDLRAYHGISTLPDGSQEPIEMRPPLIEPGNLEDIVATEITPGQVLYNSTDGLCYIRTDQNTWVPIVSATDPPRDDGIHGPVTWEFADEASRVPTTSGDLDSDDEGPDRNLWDHLEEASPDKSLWDHLNEDD